MIQSALFAFQGQQVGQRLGRVEVTAVTGVDDRTVCGQRRSLCRTGNRMAHDQDIRIAADDLCGVLQGLSLGDGRVCRVIETDQSAAQTQHCSLERHLGTGGRLIE